MFAVVSKSPIIMLLACASALAQTAPAARSIGAKAAAIEPAAARTSKTAAPEEFKLPDPAPIAAMAPEEMPARQPQVSYSNGQLRLDSDNGTLAEVLDAICKATGAQIDLPSNAATERVAAHLYGTPRQVIADLLDDEKFGYVILSPAEDPAAVQKVVLTSQSSDKPGDKARSSALGFSAERRPAAAPHSSAADTEVSEAVVSQPPARLSDMERNHQIMPAGLVSGELSQTSPPQNAEGQQDKGPMQVLQDLYRARQQMQAGSQTQKPQ